MTQTMQKNHLRLTKPLALMLLLLFSFWQLMAENKEDENDQRIGATIIVHMIDNQGFTGELLTIKGSEILLLDQEEKEIFGIDIKWVNWIKLKKSQFLKGMAIGGMITAPLTRIAMGHQEHLSVYSGWYIVTVPVGLLVGGLIGSSSHKTWKFQNRWPTEIKKALIKLSKYARFPDGNCITNLPIKKIVPLPAKPS